MNKRTKDLIIALFMGIAGFVLLWYATSWIAAAGVYLIIFGNNIELRYR